MEIINDLNGYIMKETGKVLSTIMVSPKEFVMNKESLSVAEKWLSFAKDGFASPMQIETLQVHYSAWANESEYKAAYNFWNVSEGVIRVYCLNLGVGKDSSNLAEDIRLAFSYGTCFLGYCNLAGVGVTQNYGAALRWFLESAEVPNRNAYNALFQICREGLGVQVDYYKAFSYLRTCYELGLSEADDYYNMAVCLLHGWGVDENIDAAFKCMEKAAGMNHLGAIEYLILSSLDGSEIPCALDKVGEYINQYSSLISE